MKFFRLLPLLLSIAASPAAVSAPIASTTLSAIVLPSLRNSIIADAGALPPDRLAFDRVTDGVRTGGGTTSVTKIADQWNGASWTLVATHGRQQTAAERRDHKRQSGAIPVPGYYQLGPIIAAATSATTDDQGRTLLLIPVMPADSVRTDTGDISRHMRGEVRLSGHGNTIWVEQLHVSAREAFKLNMLIKVTGFEQTSEYAPGVDGKPRLMKQTSASTGTMFSFPGGEKSQVTFVYR